MLMRSSVFGTRHLGDWYISSNFSKQLATYTFLDLCSLSDHSNHRDISRCCRSTAFVTGTLDLSLSQLRPMHMYTT